MKDDKLYLIHIAECIEKIETYVTGLDFSTFMQKTMVQDAVLRNLQILAESTQRLSEDFKYQYSEVEWYKVAGLRNILVHDYLGIDLETVWSVVEGRLPELKAVVRAALE
ncbi:MAG: DUF86 domain-containing protein [Desulfobacteraceae bacterium]|jgi:uncharacterized protein with HEPN domain|nr:MAG: DUF86 domain-containing protein [Desulfobacteraceae bacterium]